MFKVGILVWLVLGTTLAGLAMTAVLVVPGLTSSPQGRQLLVYAALGGFAVAIPFSLMIAKKITAAMGR
jgi:hypothetical protein